MTDVAAPPVYLDANILIYLVEGFPAHQESLERLVGVFESAGATFVTSELSLAEVLVRPIREQRNDLIDQFEQLLGTGSDIGTVAVDLGMLRRSAEFRAMNGGNLLDAIHVASAMSCGCSIFLSEDVRIKVVQPMQRYSLADFARRFAP
jgi:predicted nucleic acid-binding protein